MENEKIKQLFDAYNPELTPDEEFMVRLHGALATADMVMERVVLEKRRSRRAAIAAASTGFILGVVATLLYPVISSAFISMIKTSWEASKYILEYQNTIVWLLICVTIGLLSYTAYDIALLTIQPRKVRLRI